MKKREDAEGVVMIDLKLCPFCGSIPDIIREGNQHTRKRRVVIRCPTCRVERANAAIQSSMEWLETISIEQWNRRT